MDLRLWAKPFHRILNVRARQAAERTHGQLRAQRSALRLTWAGLDTELVFRYASSPPARPSPVRPFPAAYPRNRFASSLVEDFDELPGPEVELSVYEDHTRQVLAENDSPDIGFRYSINPYRGCFHGCAYCLSGDTQILMADGSSKRLSDVQPGDQVVGTQRRERADTGRRFVPSLVLD